MACLILYMSRVVCRMLGLLYGYVMSSNVPGNGTIWLTNVSCGGNEKSLSDCHHGPWGSHSCGHARDVGIVCGEKEIGSGMEICGCVTSDNVNETSNVSNDQYLLNLLFHFISNNAFGDWCNLILFFPCITPSICIFICFNGSLSLQLI